MGSVEKVDWSIYPNPASEHIRISGMFKNPVVTIRNVSGQTVYFSNNTTDEISITNWVKGVYFVNVQDGAINHYSKFIKL